MRWEEGAVRALLSLASKKRRRPPRIHVLRLTDAGCTLMLTEANAALSPAFTPEGFAVPRVTAGSCPHYALFDAETVTLALSRSP